MYTRPHSRQHWCPLTRPALACLVALSWRCLNLHAQLFLQTDSLHHLLLLSKRFIGMVDNLYAEQLPFMASTCLHSSKQAMSPCGTWGIIPSGVRIMLELSRCRCGGWVQVLRDALVAGCAREWEARRTANMLASARGCEAAEEACETVLEHEQSGALPSTGARLSARPGPAQQASPLFLLGHAWAPAKATMSNSQALLVSPLLLCARMYTF